MEKEEKKEPKMNVVKGNGNGERPQPGKQPQQQRLTYDELNRACMELSQRNQQMQQYINKLHDQIEQMDQTNLCQRLEFMFKVLKYQNNFPSDFVITCAKEIQEVLTIPEEIKNPEQPGTEKEQPENKEE